MPATSMSQPQVVHQLWHEDCGRTGYNCHYYFSERGVIDEFSPVAYTLQMPAIRRTDEFIDWLRNLRDVTARAKILERIDRLALGNAGDAAPVGQGVSELRIHHGAGYRVYFVRRGEELVLLLCGGDKASQRSDIARAKKLVAELED